MLNTPNLLTLSRIALTAIFLAIFLRPGFEMKVAALGVFISAALTDFFDGRLARWSGQITDFGRFMDPIADKILTISAFLAFVQMALIPAWMAAAIVARDFLITGLRFFIPKDSGAQAARKSGKHKTAIQMTAIILILIFAVVRESALWQEGWGVPSLKAIYFFMCLVVAVTLWSGLRYFIENKKYLSAS